MEKREIIITICFVLSTALLLASSIYTMYQLKPTGYTFNIEKLFMK